ncbi:MAG: hypothetical protein M1836_007826 [Candelina mexicana]|nr:MAG: hypothetical protein M1836_007826 [Candelina mexicana]
MATVEGVQLGFMPAPSTLLGMPVELRLMIYERLFRSLTVRHGFEVSSVKHSSILSTCRLIHQEAKPLLTPNISFHFRSTERMVDHLMILTPEQIQSIRYIRVKAFPFPLYPNTDFDCYTTYGFPYTLSMFPGLQLDYLAVEDCYHDGLDKGGFVDGGTYCDIDTLILSDGWKELHYTTPTTEFLTWDGGYEGERPPSQPAGWNADMQDRDGKGSGASVVMYVSLEPGVAGATSHPTSREIYAAAPQNSDSSPNIEREVLVVARRGRNAVYVQDGSMLDPPIQNLLRQMTWQEIKQKGLLLEAEEGPCDHL